MRSPSRCENRAPLAVKERPSCSSDTFLVREGQYRVLSEECLSPFSAPRFDLSADRCCIIPNEGSILQSKGCSNSRGVVGRSMAKKPDKTKAPDADLTDLNAENIRLRGQRELLNRLCRDIASSLDVKIVQQRVVDAACELTTAQCGVLAVFGTDGNITNALTHGMTPEQSKAIGKLPQGNGLLRLLMEGQTGLRVDPVADSRSGAPSPKDPPSKTFLNVPIPSGVGGSSNLYLIKKAATREFTEEDEELVGLLAAHAGVAFHNAGLFAQAESNLTSVVKAHRHIKELAVERDAVLETTEEERARLQALVDTSPVGVIVVDANSRTVTLVNQELQRILGFPRLPGENLGLSEQRVVYRRPDGRVLEPNDLPLQRALDRGQHVRAEEVHFEEPGHRRVPTLINATPIYAQDGTITGAVAVVQDITPLGEIERLRGEFLGMVSHEFKTPLTAIKGAAATYLGSRRSLEDEEIRELLEIVDEQSDRLRDLVDSLLDMTRIEAGVLSVRAEAADLRQLISEAQTLFARAGGPQQIILDLPEQLRPVSADRRRIAQVLGNLFSNAEKFSPPDSAIRVSVEDRDDDVAILVTDQGQGIPAEKLPHLFKKFSQVHEGHHLSGTGLGLAICKGIVEAHGGRIWAESGGEGQGATITFTLPVAGASPIEAIDTTMRSAGVGRVGRVGERTRILAVDDEISVLRLLQRQLSEAGYEPVVTSDPSQVLSLVEEKEPDLVLLDLLPGNGGFELLERIREVSGVPVIILSSSGDNEDIVRALRAGADDYTTKPFSSSELLARIEAALRRRVRPDQVEVRAPFALHDLTINFASRRVAVSGHEVRLTATEYKVLYELATNAGRILTHDQLLQRVWGPEYSGEAELVRAFIRNLRRKLQDNARNPRFVFTEPQVGYWMPKS